MLVPIMALLLNINQAETDENFEKATKMQNELTKLVKEQVAAGIKPEELDLLLHAAGWDDWVVGADGAIVQKPFTYKVAP